MTNTKFRKRALLSSVAMLLVALVALGSATFAWYAGNTTVTASGLNMKATVSAGLQILSAYDLGQVADTTVDADVIAAYGYTTNLSDTANASYLLDPASPFVGETRSTSVLKFGSAQGTSNSNGAIKAGTTVTDVTSSAFTFDGTSGPAFYEDIYLRSTGDALTVNYARVTITSVTTNDIYKGLKVALVKSDGTLIGIWKPSSSAATTVWTGSTTDTAETAFEAYSDGYKDSGVAASALNISVGNVIATGSGATVVRMYVYLDGQDENVKSDNAINIADLASDISVDFSTVAFS